MFWFRFSSLLLLLICSSHVHAQPTTQAPPAQDARIIRLAKGIEPSLQGSADRLPQYVEYFQTKLANDIRLFAFDVEASAGGDGMVVLKGYVEFPETSSGLTAYLEALGFERVDNQLEVLPSADLGKKPFGLVKTTHTLSYDRPEEPHEVVTDCLLGEPLFLLKEVGDYLLVHSREGYLGYVTAEDVHRCSGPAFDRYPSDTSVRIISNHKLDSGLVLPAGAILKKIPGKEGSVRCALPSGEVADIPSQVCEVVGFSKARIDLAINSGEELLGTPYHWGGKTAEGIDCSGLVQISFATIGLHLPRDSNQQFLVGQLTGTRWHRSRMRRGDTMYFVGKHGRIRHTALYLGDNQFLHAESPHVTIASLNPDHDNYDRRREKSFVFAKRLW